LKAKEDASISGYGAATEDYGANTQSYGKTPQLQSLKKPTEKKSMEASTKMSSKQSQDTAGVKSDQQFFNEKMQTEQSNSLQMQQNMHKPSPSQPQRQPSPFKDIQKKSSSNQSQEIKLLSTEAPKEEQPDKGVVLREEREEIHRKKTKIIIKRKYIAKTNPNSPQQNELKQSQILNLVKEGNDDLDIDNNRYQKADKIGSGAYGKVYKGLDSETGNIIAIKTIELPDRKPEQMNRDIKAIRNEI